MDCLSDWIAQSIGGQHTGPHVRVTGPVVTDTRDATPGALYVARRGENADGHDFLAAAVEGGAVAAIVEEVRGDGPATQIVVDDATVALGTLARAHLAALRQARPTLRVVAVTGSAGKTTTKDLLYQLLGTRWQTVAPKLSFNNEVGLPVTVLKADADTQILVLEMGASGSGHIRYLTDIAPPDIAIELMVGHAHMGGFGSVEGVARAKAELVQGLRSGGLAVLNYDDDQVRAMAADAPGDIIYFSPTGAHEAMVRAVDIDVDAHGRAQFTLCIGEEQAPVSLRLVGRHHVANACAAAGAAHAVGMTCADIAAALSQAKAQSPHRMAVTELDIDGKAVTLIDDAYNANIDSMRAGIDALTVLAAGRPMAAIFGEMLELGDESDAMHREVGRMAAEAGISTVITYGEAAKVLREELPSQTRGRHATSVADAVNILCEDLSDGVVIFVKGSLYSGVYAAADALIERGTRR
ncbi:UDP-N-acetylmuramoyl-tripeptide--D-alanyl-D-alanine ligase [Schaalia suimastitidis]|uniref:UDP-N-acetylmuramoyl-tripeptide--D-alanyl-D- alanine ligase n=1 Tax=Schaalia suimastitidis TaxID=121163 RepID=UPI00041F6BBF|nr:UDP-N-acetylmuramoyl-tripeptide--D-alanyl-D-alanine ligase [Schaalia suimastitidis]